MSYIHICIWRAHAHSTSCSRLNRCTAATRPAASAELVQSAHLCWMVAAAATHKHEAPAPLLCLLSCDPHHRHRHHCFCCVCCSCNGRCGRQRRGVVPFCNSSFTHTLAVCACSSSPERRSGLLLPLQLASQRRLSRLACASVGFLECHSSTLQNQTPNTKHQTAMQLTQTYHNLFFFH